MGIPTVRDRLVQPAILQVLEQIFDSVFSESSFGFRPKRSAHQSLHKASEYVGEGYEIVISRGGPLFPLLANILLDDLDKELERWCQQGVVQWCAWIMALSEKGWGGVRGGMP